MEKKKSNCVILWTISVSVLCLLSIVFSVIALSKTCYRTVDLGFDYLGVIVGSLAVLVTFLVAWNIYSVIDARSKIDEMQKEISEYEKRYQSEISNVQKKVYKTQSDIHSSVVSSEMRLFNSSKDIESTHLISNMVSAINYLSKAEEFVTTNIYLEWYTVFLRDNKSSITNTVDKELKNGILSLLYDIPNRNKLEKFREFEKMVLEIVC